MGKSWGGDKVTDSRKQVRMGESGGGDKVTGDR